MDGSAETKPVTNAEVTEQELNQQAENARNAAFARERRKAEEEAKLREAEIRGVIKATGGKNPYTEKEIKTAEDVEEFLTMQELKSQGKDPKADYSEAVKEKTLKKKSEEESKKKDEESLKKEVDDFTKKHPTIDLSKLLENEDFADYAEGKFGKFTLEEIYTKYENHLKKTTTEAKMAEILEKAKKISSPGPVKASSQSQNSEFYTEEEIDNMTRDEVKKNIDKVNKSLEHISKTKK